MQIQVKRKQGRYSKGIIIAASRQIVGVHNEEAWFRNTITKILEDKFGAEYKHTNKGGNLTFKLDKLQRLYRSYNAYTRIKSELKSDGSDSSDGSVEKPTSLEGQNSQETIKISQDNESNDVNVSEKQGCEDSNTSLHTPRAVTVVTAVTYWR